MADFKKSMKLLFEAEFSNQKEKFLHQNKGEEGLTLGGVYEKYNRVNINWEYVRGVLEKHKGDFKKASVELFENEFVMDSVSAVYRRNYWGKMRLDEVNSQKIADEMFLFGVVAHPKNAIKLAQRLVGVVDDGIIGAKTLSALNAYDESKFDLEFDEREKRYFESIVKNKPHLSINLVGWKNRADIA